jgi:predicted transcriptional regulator
MKVLLSIKPEYADKILSGEKKFEFRKSIFKRTDVTAIIIYATMPVGKVVGEFEIENILSDRPEEIWYQTKEASGISKFFFDAYFLNREKAYAIQVKNVKSYKTPMDLGDLKQGLKAPQSFAYI